MQRQQHHRKSGSPAHPAAYHKGAPRPSFWARGLPPQQWAHPDDAIIDDDRRWTRGSQPQSDTHHSNKVFFMDLVDDAPKIAAPEDVAGQQSSHMASMMQIVWQQRSLAHLEASDGVGKRGVEGLGRRCRQTACIAVEAAIRRAQRWRQESFARWFWKVGSADDAPWPGFF